MQKTRRVLCTAIQIADLGDEINGWQRPRPSEMLPWADPYIAKLVDRLRSEIKNEVSVRAHVQ